MTRPDAARIAEMTGVAEKWLRRCNGLPRDGILTDSATLRVILAMSAAAAADSFGVITWRSDGRVFTAEPVRDEPAA